MKNIFVLTALAAGLILPTIVSADDRYYDRRHRDYHNWNPREDRAWHMYWEQRHRPFVEWGVAPEVERQRYWAWRHRHSDAILHIDIR